ncbi:MAG: hypothetical protein ABEJ22_02085 [Haloferacaceae archaeon]
MVSPERVAVSVFVAALSAPFLLFPEASARLRHRNARDPEPTEAAVTEARLGGLVLLATAVVVLLSG